MSLRMRFEVRGLQRLAKTMSTDVRRTIIAPKLERLAVAVRLITRLVAPKKSGKLRAETGLKKRSDLEWHITDGTKYGAILRAGSPAHPIEPRRKRALFWPGLPHPIARVKRHPGFREIPYTAHVVRKAAPRARKTEKDIAAEIIKMFG